VFTNIQAVRAAAVYLVVIRHLLDSWNNYTGARFGYPINVPGGFSDLFFVVSGFVLAESSRGRPTRASTFLLKRLMRIVPLYWLVTAVVFISTLFGFRTFGLISPEFPLLLRSLLFLPTFEGGSVVGPILFVGWTLNFQVLLYVLFALSLATRRLIAPEISLFVLIFAILAAPQFVSNAELAYFSSEILLAFYFGALVSALFKVKPPIEERHSARFFVVFLVGGSALLTAFVLLLGPPLLGHLHLLTGGAATLVVFGASGLERKGCRVRDGRLLTQGAASYSIFLYHPLVLQLTGKAMILTGLNKTIPGTLVGYAGTLVAVAFTGVVAYKYIEQPMNQILSSTFFKPYVAA
jgi:exopolysaccharide production protein ExoZ